MLFFKRIKKEGRKEREKKEKKNKNYGPSVSSTWNGRAEAAKCQKQSLTKLSPEEQAYTANHPPQNMIFFQFIWAETRGICVKMTSEMLDQGGRNEHGSFGSKLLTWVHLPEILDSCWFQ